MSDLTARVGILLMVSATLALVVWAGRALVAHQRRKALRATAPASLSVVGTAEGVHILVFGSEDCVQCYTLQEPAVATVLAERRGTVSAIHVDAPSSPELTSHYGILTVPSTIVVTADGHTQAANFGFASSAKLLAQVDAALGVTTSRPFAVSA